MAVENAELFNSWVNALAECADVDINNYQSYMDAIRSRHDYFHANGCRLSDHGLDTVLAEDCTAAEMAVIFDKVRDGQKLSATDVAKFKSGMMLEFGRMDAEKGWVQQIHYGALRNNNSAMFKTAGPDIGFDSIGDLPVAAALSKFMDTLNSDGMLPKTIIYTLNPRDNEVLASMIGNFQGDGIPGKIQFGSGWWVNDQKDGMERQMEALSQMGLLSRFVGMLTDSRSFLSYTRHEYFRRILCNMLGNDMKAGLIPDDFELVGRMVSDICYNNAKQYFGV
jgi:glucuronate isomerase